MEGYVYTHEDEKDIDAELEAMAQDMANTWIEKCMHCTCCIGYVYGCDCLATGAASCKKCRHLLGMSLN
jgi:hypothetical protein